MSQLVTGEAVALDLTIAGVPSRLVATVLDGLVQLVLFFAMMMLVGVAGGSQATTASLLIVALVIPWLGYPVLMETLLRGRTLGKMALGLRVVRDDGGPIAFRHAFVRGLIGLFLEKPGLTNGAAAVICALVSSTNKRVGDLAAGTIVIQERVARHRTEQFQMPAPLASWAATLDLSRLSDDLAMSCRAFLIRQASLTEAARTELGTRLCGEVAAVVTPEPPSGVPAWAYLAAVLAERRRRAEQVQPQYGVPLPSAVPQGYFATSPPTTPPPTPPPPVESTSPFAPPS